MSKRKWGFSEPNIDLNRFESHIEAALSPVKPRQEFIDLLKRQLNEQSEDWLYGQLDPNLRFFVVASAGFISGVVILVLGIRAVLLLTSMLALLVGYRRQARTKRPILLRSSRRT